jgi:hypothetical protein
MSDVTDSSPCGKCSACLWVMANGAFDEVIGNPSYPACEAGPAATTTQTARREESDHE